MRKRVQIILLILTLGILLLPQQKLWAQSMPMDCCIEMSTSSESCPMEPTSQETSSNPEHDCQKHCITDCGFCLHTSLTPVETTQVLSVLSLKDREKQIKSIYQDPYLSIRNHDIWQPPKIG